MRSFAAILPLSFTLLATLLTGCGDASSPSFQEPGMPAAASGGANGGSGSAASSSNGSSAAPASSSAPSAPAAPPPSGSIYFRVANLTGAAADACVSPDGGATWVGPLMGSLAGKPLASRTVSARVTVKNAHFTARAVLGSDCKTGVGADVVVDDISGDWPATIVLGQKSGATTLRVFTDESSVSDTATFVRLIHAASWSTDADLGTTDDNGDYAGIFGDAPFLGTAKMGTLSKQGYAALDPLSGGSLILRTTTTMAVRATVTADTDVNQKYSLFTVGDEQTSDLLACDDVADPGADHLTPCSVVPNGGSFGTGAPAQP